MRERFAAVEALCAQGTGIREIARELDLDRKTARSHVQAAGVEDLLAKTTSRTSLLDDYVPYLHHRWEQGCTDITQLLGELRELGCRGSQRSLYRVVERDDDAVATWRKSTWPQVKGSRAGWARGSASPTKPGKR